jgi:hypothetical protein
MAMLPLPIIFINWARRRLNSLAFMDWFRHSWVTAKRARAAPD